MTPGGSTCTALCQSEFESCVNFGPGYDTCLSELTAMTGPLASKCSSGCTPTDAMTALGGASIDCNAACESEFNTCVSFGPGYATCASELAANTGPLAGACPRGCTPTGTMTALGGAGDGSCSGSCAVEFGVCVSAGPGYAVCQQEFTDGSGPLGSVCTAGCTQTAAMIALNPDGPGAGACSTACASEFPLCVQHGPGYAACAQEIVAGTGPLVQTGACVMGCTLTDTMAALDPASGSGPLPCSATCVGEFGNCVRFSSPVGEANHATRYANCLAEITSGTGILASFCITGCTATSVMTDLETNPPA